MLILDEVITGFRLQLEGASGYFDIKPDLVTYGKIIGGGMPVGAYGGRKDVMSVVSPVGNVYQAGTLSGNPIAMRAGITQLTILKNEKEIYAKINNLGEMFRQGVKTLLISIACLAQLMVLVLYQLYSLHLIRLLIIMRLKKQILKPLVNSLTL